MKQIAEQGFEGRDTGRDMELKKQNIKQPDISLILARFGRGSDVGPGRAAFSARNTPAPTRESAGAVQEGLPVQGVTLSARVSERRELRCGRAPRARMMSIVGKHSRNGGARRCSAAPRGPHEARGGSMSR